MAFQDPTGTIVKKICMACSREFTGMGNHCPHDGNALVVLSQDQWEGKRLAERYRIDKRLGTGGMGVVYLAWHELMERWVAIKMLKQSFVEDELSLKRFQQEAKAASRLKHPNVITLHDFGITPTRQPYMVMDYLVSTHPDPQHQARSMHQEIKEHGQIAVERCIHIVAEACHALEHAHRQGVIHRDVKPPNIMIVPNETDPYFVKVVDFGVAKLLPINNNADNGESQALTQIGEVCGSPVYMSPEQCMGQPLDPRADIYSMGVVLYEGLTGSLPLVGKNMMETMQKHLSEAPKPFSEVRPDLYIPEKLEQLVLKALAKEPHKRPQSMAELAQDLQFSIPRAGNTPSLKSHEILNLPEESTAGPSNWLPAAIGGAVIAAAAVGAFFFFSSKHEPPHPSPAVTTTAPQPAPVQPQPVSQPKEAAVTPPTATATTPSGSTSTTAATTKEKEPVASPTEEPVAHITAAPTHEHTGTTSGATESATPKHHTQKTSGDASKNLAKLKSNYAQGEHKGSGEDIWNNLKKLKSNYHEN